MKRPAARHRKRRARAAGTSSRRKVLVIDVGGTSVKILTTGQTEHRAFPSGPRMTPSQMVSAVKRLARNWDYDAVSIGYPGPVVHGCPIAEPYNLGRGWVGFDFAAAFGRPVRLVNDAAMQALGSYKGGKMLFLGLGTGFGSAMVVNGIVEPMELGHLPYKKGVFEDYVGRRGLERYGKKRSGAATLPMSWHVSLPRSNPTIPSSGEATSKSSTRCRPVLAQATTTMPSLADSGCGSMRAQTAGHARNTELEDAAHGCSIGDIAHATDG
jgi:polyphosphate glucokinase